MTKASRVTHLLADRTREGDRDAVDMGLTLYVCTLTRFVRGDRGVFVVPSTSIEDLILQVFQAVDPRVSMLDTWSLVGRCLGDGGELVAHGLNAEIAGPILRDLGAVQ